MSGQGPVPQHRFGTLSIHAGQAPDPSTDAQAQDRRNQVGFVHEGFPLTSRPEMDMVAALGATEG